MVPKVVTQGANTPNLAEKFELILNHTGMNSRHLQTYLIWYHYYKRDVYLWAEWLKNWDWCVGHLNVSVAST